jgi:hypothetical protein
LVSNPVKIKNVGPALVEHELKPEIPDFNHLSDGLLSVPK